MSAPKTYTEREKPILFSGEMVRAILDGRKTQTRRVLKPQPIAALTTATGPVVPGIDEDGRDVFAIGAANSGPDNGWWRCPYGQPGDRLWVRETWANFPANERTGALVGLGIVRGDGVFLHRAGSPVEKDPRFRAWRPSIHMPRWASRLTLEITDVRVERLHDITDADARAEGYSVAMSGPDDDGNRQFIKPRDAFLRGDWASQFDGDPWVWAITFRVDPSSPSTEGKET